MLFGDQEVYMFPFPIAIRLKYLVGILAFIALCRITRWRRKYRQRGPPERTSLRLHLREVCAPPGTRVRAVLRTSYGILQSLSPLETPPGRQEFQVYMRKHNQDPSDYFDEYGNFRPPDDKDKKNGGSKGGWVN